MKGILDMRSCQDARCPTTRGKRPDPVFEHRMLKCFVSSAF